MAATQRLAKGGAAIDSRAARQCRDRHRGSLPQHNTGARLEPEQAIDLLRAQHDASRDRKQACAA
jgi:hypothetical protein